MKYISCVQKIKIEYSGLSFGSATTGPQLFSEVEGILIVRFDDEVFLSEDGILLLELAKDLSNWLKIGGDFAYYSMDYEDGPILSFKEAGGFWEVRSSWSEYACNGIDMLAIVNGVESFISSLAFDLKLKNIDVSLSIL